jgi:ribonuclease HI
MMTIIALLWCWWTERNKANHGERRLSVSELQFTVRRHTAEWKEFFDKKAPVVQAETSCWKAPPPDWIMINIDGAFHADSGSGGWGCIARDHSSSPIFAAAGSVSNAGEAIRTETQALLQAITIAEQFGIGRPIFATDCQVLEQAINKDSYDAAPLGALFREAKYRLRLSFTEYRIVYMNRSCNKPAHELAALGAAEPSEFYKVWVVDYPNSVTSAMSGDIAAQC